MDYIELQPCPICGARPDRTKESLSRPGGHGYPGHYSYQYKCEKCGYLKSDSLNDIYYDPENADARARISWNKECEIVKRYLEHKDN
jgi:uncharacterized Zn finger protein